ncbi:cell division protein ZapA [Pseudomonas sp. GX19020]|uniref:cell division protein ZapA n=1 Tax=Pseudomonas sp. GX19020 TaxID=2942277 RepID=UPI002019BE3C|nr:cell division protein ZapA [Pseudomonas sp. GX19020]MCL4065037.1 cell division protein ZapA [Pseudomonas sp. GX19020]
MPDIEVMIGGRGFMVSCQPGEEHFLRSAAAQLDVEAQPLVASMGRLPETKMLLMAGLMLADRTAAQEEEMRELRAKLSMLEDRPEPEAKRIEVPVIPPQVPLTFAELAARAEALAERVGEKATETQRSAVADSGQGTLKKAPAKSGAILQAEDAKPEGDLVNAVGRGPNLSPVPDYDPEGDLPNVFARPDTDPEEPAPGDQSDPADAPPRRTEE